MHEHLLCDVTPPHDVRGPRVQITLENLHAVQYNWTQHFGNHILDDMDLMIGEVSDFRRTGGGAIVELTIRGIAPDPVGLRQIARSTGVAIIAGTGIYTHGFVGDWLEQNSEEQLCELLVKDLCVGMGPEAIKAGIIGEMGVSDPWHPEERKAMAAAVLAQQETGAAITVHPGRDPASPLEIIRFIERHDGDTERVVIGHLDRTFTEVDQILRLADTGCVLEWDFFGIESSYYPFSNLDMLNDAMRLDLIAALLARGHAERVVISHDICTVTRLRRMGGHGYTHITNAIEPMMQRKGFSEQQIAQILVQTPRRLLTLA